MIEVTKSGAINYVRIDEDGSKWRCALPPGDWITANQLLDAKEHGELEWHWREEVVQKWMDEHPEPAQREPRPPSAEQKIAALTEELATLRALVNEKLGGVIKR